MVYFQLRGLPQVRADFRSGQICAVLANSYRRNASDKIFTALDFMPSMDVREREESAPEPQPVDVQAASDALMAMLGRKKE